MTALDTDILGARPHQGRRESGRSSGGIHGAAGPRLGSEKSVLLETEWVLRSSYGFDPEAVVSGFRELLTASNLEMEDRTAVLQAPSWVESGMDFADALHLASVSGRDRVFATFDASLRRAAQRLGIERVVAIRSNSKPRYATF